MKEKVLVTEMEEEKAAVSPFGVYEGKLRTKLDTLNFVTKNWIVFFTQITNLKSKSQQNDQTPAKFQY